MVRSCCLCLLSVIELALIAEVVRCAEYGHLDCIGMAEHYCVLCDDEDKYFCGEDCFRRAHKRVKEEGHELREINPTYPTCREPFAGCCGNYCLMHK